MARRHLLHAGYLIAAAGGLLTVLWAAGALWHDLPASPGWGKAASAAFLAAVAGMAFAKHKRLRIAAAAMPLLVAAWWLSLQPSNDRDWLPDVDRTAHAEIAGDEVTLHNVRNFDYHSETAATPRWETRSVRLSQLTGIDMAVGYWGSPYMAHPILSFQFADAPPVCFSIETRKETGEHYSAIGGIYRQFELIYVVADERDVIGLRTNHRVGEDVYLYRLAVTPEQARLRFVETLRALNRLRERPRWYHAITTNCTTGIRGQTDPRRRAPWDWRILLNGKGDEMLYERRAIRTAGLSFADLKRASHVNAAARTAHASPDFSDRIRANLPAFRQE
jgi:hypothetical protein